MNKLPEETASTPEFAGGLAQEVPDSDLVSRETAALKAENMGACANTSGRGSCCEALGEDIALEIRALPLTQSPDKLLEQCVEAGKPFVFACENATIINKSPREFVTGDEIRVLAAALAAAEARLKGEG